jgi:phosphatidate phosphatase APP1
MAAIATAIAFSPTLNPPASAQTPSEIKSDERVLFFPTAARKSADGKSWQAEVHGWIFEPEKDDVLRGAALNEMRKLLDLDPKLAATQVFDDRIRRFLVDNERDKRVGVRLLDETFVMNESAADGHFTGVVRVDVEKAASKIRDGRLTFRAVLPPGDKREYSGEIHCLADEGVSVISDIDDTIKMTGVRSKATLLRFTFFEEFRTIDSLSEVYERWQKAGADFHYVSAAPWQLYEPLDEFMVVNGFPLGTVYLKRIRLKDEKFFDLFQDPVTYKLGVIEPFVAQFPKRKFVLVGDSGEKDPEIYGAVARRFGKQIERIYIRDVTGEKSDAARYKAAFDALPKEKWSLFSKPEEVTWTAK